VKLWHCSEQPGKDLKFTDSAFRYSIQMIKKLDGVSKMKLFVQNSDFIRTLSCRHLVALFWQFYGAIEHH